MWGVWALWVSQTEPRGMLCAPVETAHGGCPQGGGAMDPLPSSPCPALAIPTMGKWTVAGNRFAIEAKTFVLLVLVFFK